MKTRFEEIVNVQNIGGKNKIKLNDLLKLASEEKVLTSKNDKEKILLLAIDFQNDFMENGELSVVGSHKDIENTTKFTYKNFDKITDIAVSLDTHQLQQIFHPCWWVNKDGNNPNPYTLITEEDIKSGKWKAVYFEEESLAYVQNLEKQGKKKLCIWTYHCLEGSNGAALEGQFSNMVYFHSLVRQSPTKRIVKGKEPLSEMYGIIRPEYDKDDLCNYELLKELKEYDKILVVGEAKSHCVLESVTQILEHYADDKEMTSRIYILEDCMSSIGGYEEITNKAFEELKKNYGINIVKSTEFNL